MSYYIDIMLLDHLWPIATLLAFGGRHSLVRFRRRSSMSFSTARCPRSPRS